MTTATPDKQSDLKPCDHVFGNMATRPRPCMLCGKSEDEVLREQRDQLFRNLKPRDRSATPTPEANKALDDDAEQRASDWYNAFQDVQDAIGFTEEDITSDRPQDTVINAYHRQIAQLSAPGLDVANGMTLPVLPEGYIFEYLIFSPCLEGGKWGYEYCAHYRMKTIKGVGPTPRAAAEAAIQKIKDTLKKVD